ncbi:MAG: phage tail protein [Billgrantia sp.]|uniref:Tail fiber-related protein n=1 Tax=Thioalkalivibrio sulfidiphilus (strain HL-EbGR7) TaxID=396588 RepID=B8GRZ8_THISH|nr:phage tail protein [Thioalkalivibrio sulfidiphilus]ACL72702.1 tail fiber-related protein [Thioalkalivibrio sulfidiphilus HL-EbGr7]
MAGDFYTVLTAIGMQKQAAYQAGGPRVELATVHAGTGGGDSYYEQYDREALEGLEALVDEVWSAPINHLAVDDANPNWVVIEGVIPTDAGGWMIREVGVKDAEGDLIAVGRFPPTYKPSLDDGAAQDLLIRSITEWGNAEAVTLEVDPAVALASRGYAETVAAEALEAAQDYTDERIDPVDRQTGTPYRVVVVDGVLCIEDMTEE